ncbi:MAG: AraC family transcriptional regulator [Lachnospiraceae bacterium]|nr:AraC family transcriptional regulator [Lachnospiraceae bacterium]
MEKKEDLWSSFQSFHEIGEYKLLANTEDTVIIRVENETGEGDMIVYRVFDGIYLMYNDFHMAYYHSMYQAMETALAVDYCREGSLAMECDNGFYQVKKPGSVCIDSRVHHRGTARFPTNHFHGITIGFESKVADETLGKEVPAIPVSLVEIREKFCGEDGYFIIQDEESLRRLFLELYHVPEKAKLPYFRAKVMELLVCLTALVPEKSSGDKLYFYKDHVEKVHMAAKQMQENLKAAYRVEDMAKKYDISLTAFKNCFKSIYGKPVFTWLTEERMKRAGELLTQYPGRSIGDIAFEVGYESGGKFAAAFKKIYGMTPREYRSKSH